MGYKEIITYGKIDEWFTAWNGRCYIAFSGGKDSTVLAYLVARYINSFKVPPYKLTLVFINTGLEYPEIQKFVNEYSAWLQKQFPRITVELVRRRPTLNIRRVLQQFGYPVISKEVSEVVRFARQNPTGQKAQRLRGETFAPDGTKSQFNLERWAFLLDAPFAISEWCCTAMKKKPSQAFARQSGKKQMVATMADESRQRKMTWMRLGCNTFTGKHIASKPMSFWKESDVLAFIQENNIPIASVYGEIVDGRCTGCQRTGCMFCALGAQYEKGENRFERMKHTHPRHYDFCIGGGEFDTDGLWKPNDKGLGFARVLDFVGVRY